MLKPTSMKFGKFSARMFEFIKLLPLIPGYDISNKITEVGLEDILLYSATHG